MGGEVKEEMKEERKKDRTSQECLHILAKNQNGSSF